MLREHYLIIASKSLTKLLMGRCNDFLQWSGATEKYLTIELSSANNSVQNMGAFVSDFRSAKIGVVWILEFGVTRDMLT